MAIATVALSIAISVAEANTTLVAMDETDLNGLGFSAAEIDERLIYLAAIPTINTTIDIRGNEARTSASDNAVLTLVVNGCQILFDN